VATTELWRDPARPARHGTFKDATEHLDYVASLEWVRAKENLLLIGPPVIVAHCVSC